MPRATGPLVAPSRPSVTGQPLVTRGPSAPRSPLTPISLLVTGPVARRATGPVAVLPSAPAPANLPAIARARLAAPMRLVPSGRHAALRREFGPTASAAQGRPSRPSAPVATFPIIPRASAPMGHGRRARSGPAATSLAPPARPMASRRPGVTVSPILRETAQRRRAVAGRVVVLPVAQVVPPASLAVGQGARAAHASRGAKLCGSLRANIVASS